MKAGASRDRAPVTPLPSAGSRESEEAGPRPAAACYGLQAPSPGRPLTPPPTPHPAPPREGRKLRLGGGGRTDSGIPEASLPLPVVRLCVARPCPPCGRGPSAGTPVCVSSGAPEGTPMHSFRAREVGFLANSSVLVPGPRSSSRCQPAAASPWLRAGPAGVGYWHDGSRPATSCGRPSATGDARTCLTEWASSCSFSLSPPPSVPLSHLFCHPHPSPSPSPPSCGH